MTSASLGSMVEYALQYAGRGWAVFPIHSIAGSSPSSGQRCCTCGRTGCSSPGKHPLTARGFKSAITDPAKIERFWGKWPWANIGIATGAPSGGLVVLDVDGAEGFAELKALIAQKSPLPMTLRARTGNGLHVYFHCPTPLPSSARGHLHVRGDGGYVVAPPSLHHSGRRYEWIA